MDKVFKEQFRRNSILDNQSYRKNILYLAYYSGVQNYNIAVPNECFGNVYIKIKGMEEEMNFTLNGVPLIKIEIDGEYEIPVRFQKNSQLMLSGVCSYLLIKLDVGKFEYINYKSILPLNKNLIIKNNNYDIYSYGSYLDIMNDNLSNKITLSDTIFLQSYIVNDEVYIGRLVKSNCVYFCNSLDNYSSLIKIVDDCNSALVLQDYDNLIVYFIYIINNKIYYKTLGEDGVLTDMVELNTHVNKLPIALVWSQTYNSSSKCFAVINDKNSIDVYYAKYNANFQKIATYTGENIKIIEKDNMLILITTDEYRVTIRKFQLDPSKNNSNMLSLISSEIIGNVVDCEEVDGNLLLMSMGLMSWGSVLE